MQYFENNKNPQEQDQEEEDDSIVIAEEDNSESNRNNFKNNKAINNNNNIKPANKSIEFYEEAIFSDYTITQKYNINIINKENSISFIDMDIERTFAYLGMFTKYSPLSEDLREILRAFVISRPDIGYVILFEFI